MRSMCRTHGRRVSIDVPGSDLSAINWEPYSIIDRR